MCKDKLAASNKTREWWFVEKHKTEWVALKHRLTLITIDLPLLS